MRLTPDRGFASVGRDQRDVLAAADRDKDIGDDVEVLSDRTVLNDSVRFLDLVEVVRCVEEDRAGVDAGIDTQQRHADPIEVTPRQRPETPVRIAVLRADARVQNKGAEARDPENRLLEDDLAARDYEIRLQIREKLASFVRVGRRDDDPRHGGNVGRISLPQPSNLRVLPLALTACKPQPCEQPEGDHVKEAEPPNAPDFTPGSTPQPAAWITDDDETSQPQAARQPRRESLGVEAILFVTDQDHGWLLVLRMHARQ